MHMSRTTWILLCVILGGATYFWGPILGTIIAVWADVLISQMTMRYTTILGLIFLLIVLFAPQGLLGLIDSLRSKHNNKKKYRNSKIE
jgi:branched-chain amino acid transport system permease protein